CVQLQIRISADGRCQNDAITTQSWAWYWDRRDSSCLTAAARLIVGFGKILPLRVLNMTTIDEGFRKQVALCALWHLLLAAPVVLTLAQAQAGERKIEPDVPTVAETVAEPLATTPGVPFDIAFGVAFTNDYISRGITNSNGEAAIQGYVEPSVEISTL